MVVEQLAYKKIVYHALRYPTAKVTGTVVVYVGVLTSSNDKTISNAYPLFHSPIVNPIFSVGLDLVEGNLLSG